MFWHLRGMLLVSAIVFATACDTGGEAQPVKGDIDAGADVIVDDAGDRGVEFDCSNYEYRDKTYDCENLDLCAETDLTYRIACCECDPLLCEPGDECDEEIVEPPPEIPAETCMSCHNGSEYQDYAGPGLANPHPFTGSNYISCTTCHGGDGAGVGKEGSHVPVPPVIGDDVNLVNDPGAYFNRLTLAGLDKILPYEVNGKIYTGLDYLQFINPGDFRVVGQTRSCGTSGCHQGEHASWAPNTPIATSSGILSGSLYSAGIDNSIPEHQGLFQDTAADFGFRAVTDEQYEPLAALTGFVSQLLEYPEKAVYGDTNGIFQNPLYDANTLANYVFDPAVVPEKGNRIIAGTPLADLVTEQMGITCGDCHGGSAGANNRYADFRSSGCTSCHMQYSLDGRSRGLDPNVNKVEPANPDAIAAPERPHPESHQIRSVAKLLPSGGVMRGISDNACAGCHQGSNRTVLQYWGIRLDQNQDVTNGNQYPQNPANFVNTAENTRLYDPAVGNATFNGRNANQYLEFEDYDGDQRDDTPPDVHHEAGLGCIDCHGELDTHGGAPGDASSGGLASRKDQATSIECENCHGGVSTYAQTTPCQNYDGLDTECAIDNRGNVMRHVTKDGVGNLWLRSRVDGATHYLPQTRDTVVNSNKVNPLTNQLLYSPKASYAMGRADGNAQTGTGPLQQNPALNSGFSHSDDMDCASCHSAWTNNCIGCHLKGQYDDDPQNFFFSNITGERISVFQANADFVYQNPVSFTLGVNSKGKIAEMTPGSGWFYRYQDFKGDESEVFAFSDRNGNGNNPNVEGRGEFGALSHNQMMAHSIRGKVAPTKEGPRYCVNCHLTQESLDTFGDEYAAFRAAIANNDFANLDFALLQEHFGENTGNQLGSPLWISMVVGLGTGLYLFDDTGCPENPLDNNANRQYCPDGAPAQTFDPATVVYNLDRLVEDTGVSNASNGHPMLDGQASPLRDGANNPALAGPLGATLINRLSNPDITQGGIVLDSWLDADGAANGDAAAFLSQSLATVSPEPTYSSELEDSEPLHPSKSANVEAGGCATASPRGSLPALFLLVFWYVRKRGHQES